MDKCQHATMIKLTHGREGVACAKFNRNNSLGVCHECGDNPAKGVWPILPVREVTVNAAPQSRSQSPAMPISRVSPEKWPRWANWVKDQRTEGDKGVGDTVERKLGVAGAIFKAGLKAAGLGCGCGVRKDAFNIQYPYESLPPD